jgi:hypothetical protein
MKRMPCRVVVYPRDIENITGRRPRTAARILQQIRNLNKKEKRQLITVKELCDYLKVPEEVIRPFLE